MSTLDSLAVDKNDVVFLHYVGHRQNNTNCYKGISYEAYVMRAEAIKDSLTYPSKQWPLVTISQGKLAIPDLSEYFRLLSEGMAENKIYTAIPEEICKEKEIWEKYRTRGLVRY